MLSLSDALSCHEYLEDCLTLQGLGSYRSTLGVLQMAQCKLFIYYSAISQVTLMPLPTIGAKSVGVCGGSTVNMYTEDEKNLSLPKLSHSYAKIL